jgi:hypothetical protein
LLLNDLFHSLALNAGFVGRWSFFKLLRKQAMVQAASTSNSSLVIRPVDVEQSAGPSSPHKVAGEVPSPQASAKEPPVVLENGDHGRLRILGNIFGKKKTDPVPVYADTIKSKGNSEGKRTFSGKHGIVKSLVDFVHSEEVKAGEYAENNLHDLFGEKGLQITFTAEPEIKTMWQVLKQISSPTEVPMMKSKKDHHVETEEMEGNVLSAMLYDQMELGGAAFGQRTLSVADQGVEAGHREVTIPEYLQTFMLDVKCENPEVSKRILDQLKKNPELVASMQAELILRMENKKSISTKMVKGFALSAIISAGTGALYEYLLSAKLLKPLLPGAKKLIEAGKGVPEEEVGKRVIDAAPHLLPAGSKVGALVIDDIPPGGIEVVDTLGALAMKGSEKSPEGLPKVEVDRTRESLAVSVSPSVAAEEEEGEPISAKMKGAFKGGGISMGLALPALALGYFKSESAQEKALMAIGAILAELTQVAGATSGVSIELREDLTKKKAQILQLIREGVIAPVPAGVSEQSYVEGKAKRQIARASATSTAQAAIGSGTLLAVMVAVFGANILNMMSEKEARPFKSAVYQPWEAIGMMLITLAAMHFGLPSKLGRLSTFISNDEQKSSQRMATMLEKHADNKKLTNLDNLLIDKPFLSLLGQEAIAVMAAICVAAIKGGEKLHLWNDRRDEARIPYQQRNPILEQQLREIQVALAEDPESVQALSDAAAHLSNEEGTTGLSSSQPAEPAEEAEEELITPAAAGALMEQASPSA